MVQEHINFPGEGKRTRTHQNFQESFLKIPQEHIGFDDFPGGKNIINK